MSVLSAFAITEALSIAVKATVLLAVALGLQQLLKRRSSAATRHVVLALAVVSLLLLPVATILAPEWGLMHREPVGPTADNVATGREATAASPSEPIAVSPSSRSSVTPANARGIDVASESSAILLVYVVGAGVVLLRLLLQRLAIRRFLRSTTIIEDAGWRTLFDRCAATMNVRRPVRLLRSCQQNVPLAAGRPSPRAGARRALRLLH